MVFATSYPTLEPSEGGNLNFKVNNSYFFLSLIIYNHPTRSALFNRRAVQTSLSIL